MDKIDFVLIWVDGNNVKWRSELLKYASTGDGDKRVMRFRDWNNLQYWFRSVEHFAPWVNKIHFVTCGHIPDWLNLDAPKLNFVKHSDFIPRKYLPTFSSHTIELNLHRIEGLAEHFVYFNDDTFLLRPVGSNRFFQNGLPCDAAILNAISMNSIGHIILNNLLIINGFFQKRDVMFSHPSKWINWKYGCRLFRTILLLPWPNFTGFIDPHLPNSFLKSTLNEVWEKNYETLDKTCSNRFRNMQDVNQYLFRYWQLVKGDFSPVSLHDSIKYNVNMNVIDDVEKLILHQSKAIVCLNDDCESDFDLCAQRIIKAFEFLLPQKSSFEI